MISDFGPKVHVNESFCTILFQQFLTVSLRWIKKNSRCQLPQGRVQNQSRYANSNSWTQLAKRNSLHVPRMISKWTFPFDVDERGGLFLPPSCQPPQSLLSSTFQWAGGLAWLIRTWWQIGLAVGLPAVYYMKLFLNWGITFPFFTRQIWNRHSFHIQNRPFLNI